MTLRPSDQACEKALAALTREAADQPLPELDWDRVEAAALAGSAVGQVPAHATAPRVSAVRWAASPPTWASTPWPVAVAAAAAAALIYASPSGTSRAPVEHQQARAAAAQRSPVADLSALEVGDVAETGGRTAVYDKPGVVSFALAPNSRIEVVANDIEEQRTGGITVALSRGSIHADVSPRSEGEVFAVEVERTRIAVHGTSFTVSRDHDRVIVDVAHGSVAVGPVGYRGSTQGWLVVGPDRAAFSLDGAREATWRVAATEDASAAAESIVETPSTTASGAPASRTKRPAVPTAATSARPDATASFAKGEVSSAAGTTPKVTAWGAGAGFEGRDASEREAAEVSAILRKLETCYEKQGSAFGVRFFVESSLALTILPSGAIREGIFTPPLSPTLMSCADKAIGAAHFPGGEAARQIRIPVQLSRAPR